MKRNYLLGLIMIGAGILIYYIMKKNVTPSGVSSVSSTPAPSDISDISYPTTYTIVQEAPVFPAVTIPSLPSINEISTSNKTLYKRGYTATTALSSMLAKKGYKSTQLEKIKSVLERINIMKGV